MPRAGSSMKLEAKKFLFDVIKACDDVEQFTTGKALDDYLAGEMLRAAVERKFEIIGEALVRLRAKDEETFRQIMDETRLKTDIKRLRGLRARSIDMKACSPHVPIGSRPMR